LDNFYDDPDEVRNYALSLNYNKHKSTLYPGIRSGLIDNKQVNDPNLKQFYSYFLKILNKKIGIFDINDCFNISTGFHKIPVFSNNLKSILNTGFIHVDLFEYFIVGKKTFAGLIYLNEKTCPTSGTSFFKMKCTKDNQIKITDNNNLELFNSLYDNGLHYDILSNNYSKLYDPFLKRKCFNYFVKNKKMVDLKFEKLFEVENVYNRIVLYDSKYFHTASHFYVNDFEDRLTQPFFIKML
jgi:hypothetical protein